MDIKEIRKDIFLKNYKVTEVLYSGNHYIIYGAVQEKTNNKAIIKLTKDEFPEKTVYEQIKNEYKIVKLININKVLKII